MAKINRLMVGESLVGDGNEIAHIDLILGPRGSAAETAFCNCLTNNKDGFTALLAVVAPNLMCKPSTVMFNKVTIKGAKQAVQMFGPAQRAVAMAVADSVEDGTIPADEARRAVRGRLRVRRRQRRRQSRVVRDGAASRRWRRRAAPSRERSRARASAARGLGRRAAYRGRRSRRWRRA